MRLSASKRALYQRCAFWTLPTTPLDAVVGDGATQGSEAHAAFEDLTTGAERPHAEHARAKADALRPVLAQLTEGCSETWAEVSFAWDPASDTARVLGIGAGREVYVHASEGEVTGTADFVGQDAGGHLIVIDYKNHVPGREVDAFAQLRTLGLFAARALGCTTVDCWTVEVGEDGCNTHNECEMDVFALDTEAADLASELGRTGAELEPHPGPWCQALYCPAAPQCPATRDALTQVLPAEMLVRHKLSPVIASADHAAWSLTAVDLVEEALKVIRVALRAFADEHGGIPLPDGSTYQGAEVTTIKPTLDVPGAVDAIRAAGGEEALSVSTTWTALDKVLGKAKAKDVREALTSMGAVKTSTAKRYEAKKPKRSK